MNSQKKQFAVIVLILVDFLLHNLVCAADLQGPYIGQSPPGFTPKIFAPGVVSISNRFDFSGSFSPDGNEFYFTYSNPDWSGNRIMVTRMENGTWITPAVVPFSGWDVDWSVFVSPDGQRLFFSSGRPNMSWVLNIWMCERQGAGWGDPVKLALNVSGISDYAGTCTRDGTLYFASNRDGSGAIYKSTPIAGVYSDAEKLPYPVNTAKELNPYIAPDENYLLFASERSGDRDLYISYRNIDDSWTEPVNLGPSINTQDWEGNPFLSPDGKYLFFNRDTGLESSPRRIDIYWVSTKAFLPDTNGSIRNLITGQRFGSIQCAVNYALPGEIIEVGPGSYKESVVIDKDIVIKSIDPNNPFYIGGTIINGDSEGPVLMLSDNSSACQINGLTIRAGETGISGSGTNAAIYNCRIMDNISYGIKLTQESKPHLLNCLITANGQVGIIMLPGSGRGNPPCEPIIENCIIVDNGQAAITGGEPVIINSLIEGQ